LNTAGGLAVHIQQVHKLEPDQSVPFHFLFLSFAQYYSDSRA
jgi:hypothetical protein